MSESKKMDILNEMFISADNAKVEFGEECKKIQDLIKVVINSKKSSSGENLLEVFKNLKTFLESANGTMKSIEDELRDIAGDCSKIQMELMSK